MAKHKPTKPDKPDHDHGHGGDHGHGHDHTIEQLTERLEEIKGEVAALGGTLTYTLTPPPAPVPVTP